MGTHSKSMPELAQGRTLRRGPRIEEARQSLILYLCCWQAYPVKKQQEIRAQQTVLLSETDHDGLAFLVSGCQHPKDGVPPVHIRVVRDHQDLAVAQ